MQRAARRQPREWADDTAVAPEEAFGLRVSRAGLCQATARLAHQREPTYEALVTLVDFKQS